GEDGAAAVEPGPAPAGGGTGRPPSRVAGRSADRERKPVKDGDARVRRLLEEILDTGCTPEEVCRDNPELLPVVRERWRRLRAVQSQVGELFPQRGWTPSSSGTLPELSAPDFPRIPSYEVLRLPATGATGI